MTCLFTDNLSDCWPPNMLWTIMLIYAVFIAIVSNHHICGLKNDGRGGVDIRTKYDLPEWKIYD